MSRTPPLPAAGPAAADGRPSRALLAQDGGAIRVAESVRPRAPAVSPEACAAAVLDVMPAVMDAMRAAMRAQVGDASGETLSVPQFRALNHIGLRPGCSVSAVAAFLGVTLPTASVMVDRLVKAGMVETRTDARDRRRSALHLTEAGAALLSTIEAGALRDFARALAERTPAERQQLQQGLAVLRKTFDPA